MKPKKPIKAFACVHKDDKSFDFESIFYTRTGANKYQYQFEKGYITVVPIWISFTKPKE